MRKAAWMRFGAGRTATSTGSALVLLLVSSVAFACVVVSLATWNGAVEGDTMFASDMGPLEVASRHLLNEIGVWKPYSPQHGIENSLRSSTLIRANGATVGLMICFPAIIVALLSAVALVRFFGLTTRLSVVRASLLFLCLYVVLAAACPYPLAMWKAWNSEEDLETGDPATKAMIAAAVALGAEAKPNMNVEKSFSQSRGQVYYRPNCVLCIRPAGLFLGLRILVFTLPLAVLVLGVGIAVGPWLEDRRRKRAVQRGTCGVCGYALKGAVRPRCPECGWEYGQFLASRKE